MMKIIKALLNFVKSYFYDIIYFFQENVKKRVLADTYNKYKLLKNYPQYLQSGAALDGVLYLALKYCKGNGIDIGAGNFPFKNARPIDNDQDENAYKINEDDNSLDFVFSSHLLEHLGEPYDAIDIWTKKIKKGGILFLYLPHPACKMWLKENLKFHVWNPDPYVMYNYIMENSNYDLLKMTYLPDAYFSFVVIAQKK